MIDRRNLMYLGAGAAVGATLLQSGSLFPALAAPADYTSEVERLERLADEIEPGRAKRATPTQMADDPFNDNKRRLLELMDTAERHGENGAGLLNAADDALARMTAEESQTPKAAFDLTYNSPEARQKLVFNDKLRDEYRHLFDTLVFRDKNRPSLDADVTFALTDPRNAAYKDVEKRTGTPWYLVSAIHNLECSFNLRRHLHNGDPIAARTVHVPKNRPVQWLPPSDWASSAVDALGYDGFLTAPASHGGWSIELMLYQLERYNGVGYRGRGINSPYLWSWSNHYTKGKYVADGVWDSEAVSAQCGAAVLIKAMVERGAIAKPPYHP